MRHRLAAGAAVLALAGTARAAPPACTPGTPYEPALCPAALPPVRALRILENGATSALEQDPAADCSRFKLSPHQVRRYLARAGQVQGNSGQSTLDWSPCHASGTVVFADGRKGQWRITRLRVGSLILEGQPERVLYCPRCRERPFTP